MQERTRYRVTGSLFLLALAVIFLPMLFDGRSEPAPAMPVQRAPESLPEIPDFEDIVPASDVVERAQALQAEVDEEGFSTSSGTRFGEPVLSLPDPYTTVWAVQAASFASLDNARNFREQLRAGGYEAFVSSVRTSGEQVMHRVAVGPYLDIADADAAVLDIADAYSVNPRVVELEP